jgi:hypothetical protein
MKSIFNKTYVYMALMISVVMLSCEQETYEPNLTTAPGGGTVTTYKAYALSPSNADNIYGRIVFYKYSSTVTLVQIGLYNTKPASTYSAIIAGGKTLDAGTATLYTLDTVNGETGAFGTFKYFTISKADFFDQLDAYNANVKVKLAASDVAAGNIGANAEPVAAAD